jgi:hypothetical protein
MPSVQQPLSIGSAALPFVIPSAPRISYCAASERATCAAFVEESHMKFADHTKLDRKSGEAEGSAVPRTFLGNVFRPSEAQWRDLRFLPQVFYNAASGRCTKQREPLKDAGFAEGYGPY